MYHIGSYSIGKANRYSAKNNVRPTSFMILAPEAKEVFVVGDFNDWQRGANPMSRQPDGGWVAQVPLNHGHHQYLFLVDGEPKLDPRAQGTARNAQNEKVSLIAVS